MAAFSVATGMTLLMQEGLLPPNPARQAVAFTSPAQAIKLESEGLAMNHTAAALAMQDQLPDGTVELSPAALQFLMQNLSAPATPATDSAEQANGAASGVLSATGTQSNEKPGRADHSSTVGSQAPPQQSSDSLSGANGAAVTPAASPSASINLLA